MVEIKSPVKTCRRCLLLGLVIAASALPLASSQEVENGEDSGSSTVGTVLNYVAIVVLVCLSGMFSGLTLGLMSLDKVGLEIVIGAGEAELATAEHRRFARAAKKIKPLRDKGNLLLCTLLLGNVAVNSLLSILMADLTSGLVGVIISTAVITIFGEITPQAVCSRYSLQIGSKAVPVVRVVVVLLYPLAKPLSMALDYALGDEIGTIHSKPEIHVKHQMIDHDEEEIMKGALRFRNMIVSDVMTPASQVYSLNIVLVTECLLAGILKILRTIRGHISELVRVAYNSLLMSYICVNDFAVTIKLDFETIASIFKSGYSRIPVWGKDPNDVVGLLFTKDLIFVDPEDEIPVLNFVQIFGRGAVKAWPDSSLSEVLKQFKEGRSHIALVYDVNNSGLGDPFYEFLGVVTLEDIIEEILQDEIVDETDVYVDNRKKSLVGRQFDYGKLRLLDARIVDSRLSAEEVRALSAHLRVNYTDVFGSHGSGGGLCEESVKKLLRDCPVVELIKGAGETDWLYNAGEADEMCTLIIQGKLEIRAGRQGFRSEAGPWTVLSIDTLAASDDFVVDFSAKIASDKVRCLRVSRAMYQHAVQAEQQQRQGREETIRRNEQAISRLEAIGASRLDGQGGGGVAEASGEDGASAGAGILMAGAAAHHHPGPSATWNRLGKKLAPVHKDEAPVTRHAPAEHKAMLGKSDAVTAWSSSTSTSTTDSTRSTSSSSSTGSSSGAGGSKAVFLAHVPVAPICVRSPPSAAGAGGPEQGLPQHDEGERSLSVVDLGPAAEVDLLSDEVSATTGDADSDGSPTGSDAERDWERTGASEGTSRASWTEQDVESVHYLPSQRPASTSGSLASFRSNSQSSIVLSVGTHDDKDDDNDDDYENQDLLERGGGAERVKDEDDVIVVLDEHA